MSITMREYLHSLAGKRLLVLGLGISNQPLVRRLLAAGLDVTACDKTPRDRLDPAVEALEALGAKLRLGEDYLSGLSADVVFRTPGLHPGRPEIQALVQSGAVLTSEMEAFFQVCPCPILAVTGSDGKTTTTTLISEFLKAAGKRVWLGGNIGHPLFDQAEQMGPGDYAVVELSSFQLLSLRCSPCRAVVTNLAPNHLDIHTDMAEYIAAKKNIFLRQGSQDLLVLNLDNDLTRDFAGQAKSAVSWFSRREKPERGVYWAADGIYRTAGGQTCRLMSRADILLPGDHNVENYLAAIAAVEGLVPDEALLQVARTFAGVEHRIERVCVKEGVTWYNDSIASSPSRTIAGLRSFPNRVILIAGGYDKHIPYDSLGQVLADHVKLLILTGDTGPKIRAALQAVPGYAGDPPILDAGDLPQAVQLAHQNARPGDVVVLSPASASFDHFKNFEERGNVFKGLVERL